MPGVFQLEALYCVYVAGAWRAIPTAYKMWRMIRMHKGPNPFRHIGCLYQSYSGGVFVQDKYQNSSTPLALSISPCQYLVAFEFNILDGFAQEGFVQGDYERLSAHFSQQSCDFGYVCVVVEEVFDEVFELDVIVEIIDHAKAVALVVVPE